MSVYLVKNKGWRYDFTLKGQRHTEAWFKTKRIAQQAEARRKEAAIKPPRNEQISTDMAFLDLVNRRLDYAKAYNSARHYSDYCYMAKRWVQRWGNLPCGEIHQDMMEQFLLERAKVSPFTANKELRYIRATFNFGRKKKWIRINPTDGIDFLPVVKRIRYIPSPEDIDRVIAVADTDTHDYLWAIRDTIARVSEINRLTWNDVVLDGRYLILYTRKKKGGHLTPRKVPLTDRLHKILSRRYAERDSTKPWVFWHTYWSSKTGEKCEGPYKERKRIMETLCKQANVQYFRFHALRHSGASQMEKSNVSIGAIQRILGHENRSTTEIYLHSIGDAERDAIATLEKVNGNSHTESHTPGMSSNCRLL
jgi:integrase